TRNALAVAFVGAGLALLVHATRTPSISTPQFLAGMALFAAASAAAVYLCVSRERERSKRLLEEQERIRQEYAAQVLGQEKELDRADHERLRQETARQARLSAISQLSSSVGHDLRNPLGVIRNAVYLLRRRLAKLDVKIDLLNIIEDEVKIADSVITNL